MTVWLVVSILVVILSPLAWLRPSRKQSRQMSLRLEARRAGLAMQLAPQQWPHWLDKEPPSPCPQYHRARRAGHADTWSYWQVSPGVWWNQWREVCAEQRLVEVLAQLPESVYKVEADRQMIALYWGERGESGAVQIIKRALDALA